MLHMLSLSLLGISDFLSVFLQRRVLNAQHADSDLLDVQKDGEFAEPPVPSYSPNFDLGGGNHYSFMGGPAENTVNRASLMLLSSTAAITKSSKG